MKKANDPFVITPPEYRKFIADLKARVAIGVAAYQLQSKLPADLKGKLPGYPLTRKNSHPTLIQDHGVFRVKGGG